MTAWSSSSASNSRFLHHHLDVLQLQAVALLQGHPAAEAGQQIQNFLPGFYGRIPHHHVAPGVAGKILDFHFGKRHFSARRLWQTAAGCQVAKKSLDVVKVSSVLGVAQPDQSGTISEMFRLHQVVNNPLGLPDAGWGYSRFRAPGSGSSPRTIANRLQAQFKKITSIPPESRTDHARKSSSV